MTNLRENQKTVTKKPKVYGEVLVSGRKMFFFWFSLSFFGFVWWARTLLFQQKRIYFYETSRKPKNQKTKTFWRSFGFRSKDVFFGFLEFFLFFLFRFLKTKKNLGFFGFLKEVLLEVRQKTKKTQGFFCFFGRMFRIHV